ncbi:DUF4240 domain-containing protein [Actinomadura sp. B10D3]|uniref:DUF4240 domain-containing protein n=1 Tax=Actinomadura sp. B10D3 TaxID=3153557 RepID=UPI00325D031B
MKIEEFWNLIEQSGRDTPDQRSRTAWLEARLTERRPAEIADFQVFLDRARERIDTHDMWVAADQIFGGACSSDSFWYFQVWLIGLGRQAFEHAAADPDNLADLPQVTRLAGRPMRDWSEEDEWPWWEELGYVARHAFDQVTGKDEGIYDTLRFRGHHSRSAPEPTGKRWDSTDPAELSKRLPRLSRLLS